MIAGRPAGGQERQGARACQRRNNQESEQSTSRRVLAINWHMPVTSVARCVAPPFTPRYYTRGYDSNGGWYGVLTLHQAASSYVLLCVTAMVLGCVW